MSFHRTVSPITHNYNIPGTILQRCQTFRDLGVTLDCKLNFHQHYSDILDKANKMVGFIRRQSREFSDPHCLLMLYKSLVCPLLESSSVVWSTSSSFWSKKLESVQRNFTRFVLRFTPCRNLDPRPFYETRCLLFGLKTFEKRREVAKQKFISKLILGETDAPRLLAIININVPSRTFRNYRLLKTQLARRAYSENDPITAMALKFNANNNNFDWHHATHF